jgi:hypothetical protein
MKSWSWYAALVIFALSGPLVVAQSELKPSATAKNVPRLVETMSAAQSNSENARNRATYKQWGLRDKRMVLLHSQ